MQILPYYIEMLYSFFVTLNTVYLHLFILFIDGIVFGVILLKLIKI
jgi:hypothetical protein